MALSKLAANSFDLTDNYALTGTVTGATSTQKLFLIKNIDASSSSTVSFVDGSSSVVLDNTYKTYLFKFVNIHPSNNATRLQYNLSVDGGSNYNVAKTTTSFKAYHNEGNSASALTYETGTDLAQGTGTQFIGDDISNANDASMSGEMFLFNPSSTTFVKHIITITSSLANGDFAVWNSTGTGYGNTTSAVDAVQFTMSSGTIDSGRIALYGIK
tara:strand:- start:523 stop:1164 length:642 start_codon:yes stop_codon:yes gene_type:complete